VEVLLRALIRNSVTISMETEGYVLQIFARVIQYFSHPQATLPTDADQLTAERIRTVISYVITHYKEPVRLSDVADQLGFSKEYFCRFFKKSMGMSFLHYLNEVRAAHVYQDLENTDLPVAEVMEQNGFTNQKLFNRTFKTIYGCTPLSVRKKKNTTSPAS
ncbi:MAG: AraC family transcriptional regulator, partial [Lachnospiraceae bacterium]|nr:AraC family transcriptional regulator [Lachnospiraceae bacterium]